MQTTELFCNIAHICG